ncbi:hypothetical protein [Rhizobium sp. BR 249]|uniref:hypothetical protein n=1 Tax=Rhizobium sp. BR 249 TaxID=3040011 RepID=UPI0039BFC2EB
MLIEHAEQTLSLLSDGERGVKLEFEPSNNHFVLVKISDDEESPSGISIRLVAQVQLEKATRRTSQRGFLSPTAAVKAAISFLSGHTGRRYEPSRSSMDKLAEVHAAFCRREREEAFLKLLEMSHEHLQYPQLGPSR